MVKITQSMIDRALDEGYSLVEAQRGYVVATSDYGNGATHIEKIDCMDAFGDDEEAARQAEKDGYKIIKDISLPQDEQAAYLDTPQNRELLKSLAL